MTQSDMAMLRGVMVCAAQAGSQVYYGDLMGLTGLNRDLDKDRAELGQALDDINTAEIAAGRPPLSAVAVSKADDMPSKGFFDYANANNLRAPGESDHALFVRLATNCYACTTW